MCRTSIATPRFCPVGPVAARARGATGAAVDLEAVAETLFGNGADEGEVARWHPARARTFVWALGPIGGEVVQRMWSGEWSRKLEGEVSEGSCYVAGTGAGTTGVAATSASVAVFSSAAS